MSVIIADMAKEWDRSPFDAMLLSAKANGYRKMDVAKKLGIPASTLSDWVKGKHAPHPMFREKFDGITREMERRPKKRGKK